jgi:predicted ATP-binding protein involved in virulence
MKNNQSAAPTLNRANTESRESAMTNIEIQQISMTNFKGIRNLTIDFEPQEYITFIKGQNGTGKSTIVDAFHWLLFGKDANGTPDTKFHIKNQTLIDRTHVPFSNYQSTTNAKF